VGLAMIIINNIIITYDKFGLFCKSYINILKYPKNWRINSFYLERILMEIMLCCIIQKVRYLVTLLTLITNGQDTNYYNMTEDFQVS
jgi:hypothetical protein